MITDSFIVMEGRGYRGQSSPRRCQRSLSNSASSPTCCSPCSPTASTLKSTTSRDFPGLLPHPRQRRLQLKDTVPTTTGPGSQGCWIGIKSAGFRSAHNCTQTKLEPSNAPIDILVIDSAEKPTAN